MITHPFGPTGHAVPLLGQGTWNMERDDHAAAVAAHRAGIDAGMTHIDTAEMYGNGKVEELVGEAIAGRRDELFLVSKVLPNNASFKGVLRACEASLRRLGTDRLDVYLLHWRSRHPLEGTIEAFEKLVNDGKIGAWGVSNFDVDDLEEALAVAGPGRITCNQVLYPLGERAIEHAVLPWCREHEVSVVAYSPFGSGRFPAPGTSGGRVLVEIATAHSAAPHQVAVRFLVRELGVFAIPKASRADHAVENAAAAALELTAAELERIGRAFPRGRLPRELPVI